jgi:hypothetical protein
MNIPHFSTSSRRTILREQCFHYSYSQTSPRFIFGFKTLVSVDFTVIGTEVDSEWLAKFPGHASAISGVAFCEKKCDGNPELRRKKFMEPDPLKN